MSGGGSYIDAHGYHLTASSTANRRLYRLLFSSGNVWAMNLDTTDTTNPANWKLLPSNGVNQHVVNAIEFFPERNCLMMLTSDGGNVREFREATQTWHLVTPPGNNLGSTWNWIVYNPALGECLFGSRTNEIWIYHANGTWMKKSDTPPMCRSYDGSGFTGLWTVDPASGLYLVLTDPTNGTGRNLYTYNSATDAYALAAAQLPAKKLNGSIIACPVPEAGVVMFAWGVGSGGGSTGVYLYKHG